MTRADRDRTPRVGDVAAALERWAPPELAEAWDRVGLQLGHPDQPVRRVLVVMDVTSETVDEAGAWDADLIVSHHPLIFDPLTAVRSDEPAGELIVRLLRAGTAVYVAHTNLDRAHGGVNDALAHALRLQDVRPLTGDGSEPGLGRVGLVEPARSLSDLARDVKRLLDLPYVLAAGSDQAACKWVAVCGGSGGDLIEAVLDAGADVYVSGDLKYHVALSALQRGLALIDAGHYGTERPALAAVRDRLARELSDAGVDVRVSQRSRAAPGPWSVI